MIRAFPILATALVLAACSATESHDAASMDARVASANTKAPPPRPANDLPARSVLDAMPDFNGIGPLRFGMSAEQMRKAWGAPLYGETPADDSQACYYVRPNKESYDLLFMVEGDRFVRIDVKADGKTAPGGGRVGMNMQQVEKLYAGRVHVSPGKYDPGEKILGVMPSHGEKAKMIFETDASGLVKSWRIGIPPQIDYVEGCS